MTKEIKCRICEEINDQLKPVHISNYSHLNPNQINWVCSTCYLERVIPNPQINYCPYLGEGYQGWDLNRTRYDCQCLIK